MTEADWLLIDELLQGLLLVASGRASPEFQRSVEERLFSVTADEQARAMLRQLIQPKKPWWKFWS